MRIACRCEKCNTLFMQSDDDICIEIDFKNRTISFVCRAKGCKHHNILDLNTWQKLQERSPLPKIAVV